MRILQMCAKHKIIVHPQSRMLSRYKSQREETHSILVHRHKILNPGSITCTKAILQQNVRKPPTRLIKFKYIPPLNILYNMCTRIIIPGLNLEEEKTVVGPMAIIYIYVLATMLS